MDKLERWITANYRIRTRGDYLFDYHSHAQYEIYYFHQGRCKFLIHHTIYDLKPDDIIIMDGLTAHRANPVADEIYERSLVHFSPSWIMPIIESFHMPELLMPFKELKNCLIRGNDEGERSIILHSIKELDRKTKELEDDDHRLKEMEVKLLLLQVLLQIYKLARKDHPKLVQEKNEKVIHVENTASYIQKHFKEKITLDDISSSLNLSKFYLSRIFKEVTGITVMDYLMECRLNQVKYDLEMHPNKSIREIALDAGFESPAHFSRFFKSRMGITPSEYRSLKNIQFMLGER